MGLSAESRRPRKRSAGLRSESGTSRAQVAWTWRNSAGVRTSIKSMRSGSSLAASSGEILEHSAIMKTSSGDSARAARGRERIEQRLLALEFAEEAVAHDGTHVKNSFV